MLEAVRGKPNVDEQELQLEARIRTLQKRSAAGTIETLIRPFRDLVPSDYASSVMC
jgi:hypothetical protein